MQSVSGVFYSKRHVGQENFFSYYNSVFINYDFKDINDYRIFMEYKPYLSS